MKNKYIYFLFLIIPLLTALAFYLGYFTHKEYNIGAYYCLITYAVLLYTIYITKSFNSFIILFALLFFVYTFLFNGEINKLARANITFTLTCTSLLFAANANLQSIDINKMNKFFIWFLIIFIPLFLISVNISGVRTGGNKENYRTYYDGFINAHSFGYYAVALGFYFLCQSKYPISAILFLLSFLSGARSVFLLLVFSIVIFNMYNFKLNLKFILYLILFILILISIYPYIKDIYVIKSVVKLAGLGANVMDSKESAALTAGRSYMWTLGINEMVNNFNFSEVIFGRGPISAEVFTFKYKGWVSWFHNDFLQIAYCYGLLGLGLYLSSILYYYKKTKDFFLVGFIFIAGFTNGFYLYHSIQIILISLLANKFKNNTYGSINTNVSI